MSNFKHCCAKMEWAINSADMPLRFSRRFREYGIEIQDGGSSYVEIAHCPWCGKHLPPSLRDEWFEALDALGVDPQDGESIPREFQDESWYEG